MKKFLVVAALLLSAVTFASNGDPIEKDPLNKITTKATDGDLICCKKNVTVAIMYNEKYYSASAEITACLDEGKTFDETYSQACTEAHDTALAAAHSIVRQMIANDQ